MTSHLGQIFLGNAECVGVCVKSQVVMVMVILILSLCVALFNGNGSHVAHIAEPTSGKHIWALSSVDVSA